MVEAKITITPFGMGRATQKWAPLKMTDMLTEKQKKAKREKKRTFLEHVIPEQQQQKQWEDDEKISTEI